MSAVAVMDAAEQAQVRSAGRLFDPGGRPTLDDVVTALWDAHSAAACLVCGADLPAAGEGEAFTSCPACGSLLE
jgi:hypothetical protein